MNGQRYYASCNHKPKKLRHRVVYSRWRNFFGTRQVSSVGSYRSNNHNGTFTVSAPTMAPTNAAIMDVSAMTNQFRKVTRASAANNAANHPTKNATIGVASHNSRSNNTDARARGMKRTTGIETTTAQTANMTKRSNDITAPYQR